MFVHTKRGGSPAATSFGVKLHICVTVYYDLTEGHRTESLKKRDINKIVFTDKNKQITKNHKSK